MIKATARIKENLKQDKSKKRLRTSNALVTGAASLSRGQQPRVPKTAGTSIANALPKGSVTSAVATTPNSLLLLSCPNLPLINKSKIKCFGY